MTPSPAIEARGLFKSFQRGVEREFRLIDLLPFVEKPQHTFDALEDVSFQVERGETLGVIGTNGAGKTTLMRLLLGVTRPTRGELILRGRTVGLLDVGGGVHPDLTGRENIYFAGAFLGLDEATITARFEDICRFAEVERFPGFLDTPGRRFSAGMMARLAFATTLYADPEILIVDEVLAVGDAAFRAKCLEALNHKRADGLTVVLVSHNLEQVEDFCHRVLWLQGGQREALGPATEIVPRFREQQAVAPLR